MRILIVGLNFAPELTGVGKYTGEMAAWFARHGHDVTVITTRPYYPEWKRTPGWRRFTWQTENWNGCRIIRCPLYVPQQMSGVQRMLHLASYAASSAPAAIAQLFAKRADVVAAIAPTLFSAPVALGVARLMGAKAWLHFQDLEFDAAFELGIVRNRRFIAAAMKGERYLATHFDLVSAISPKMVEAVARKGVARDRLMLFPNWVDMERIFRCPVRMHCAASWAFLTTDAWSSIQAAWAKSRVRNSSSLPRDCWRRILRARRFSFWPAPVPSAPNSKLRPWAFRM